MPIHPCNRQRIGDTPTASIPKARSHFLHCDLHLVDAYLGHPSRNSTSCPAQRSEPSAPAFHSAASSSSPVILFCLRAIGVALSLDPPSTPDPPAFGASSHACDRFKLLLIASSQTYTCKPLRAASAQLFRNLRHPLRCFPHHRLTDPHLHPIQLAIHCLQTHRHLVRLVLIRCS
jgi:hypothetical protein